MDDSKNTINELNVKVEFKNLIPPLTYPEYSQLEKSIIRDGCLSQIVIWGSRNIIIDGHNRYNVCIKNNIEFNTTSLEFESETEAKFWIIKNQFSRRNLNNFQKVTLVLNYEEIYKTIALEKKISCLRQFQNPVNQISDERQNEEVNTDKNLADLVGLSRDTISRVRNIINKVDDETKSALNSGKKSINEVYIEQKVKEELEKENEVAQKLEVKRAMKKNNKYKTLYNLIYYKENYYDQKHFEYFNSKTSANSVLFVWANSTDADTYFNKIKKFGFTLVKNYFWFNEISPSNMKILICAKKGDIVFPEDKSSILHIEKMMTHLYPNSYYDLIESLFPNQTYFEINSGEITPYNEKWETELNERAKSLQKKVA